jgi:putrescine importer
VAGSAYTNTQRSFGRHARFLADWALILDYLFLPMINYLLIGIYLNAEFPSVPAWVWVIVAIVFVTTLNIVGPHRFPRCGSMLLDKTAVSARKSQR